MAIMSLILSLSLPLIFTLLIKWSLHTNYPEFPSISPFAFSSCLGNQVSNRDMYPRPSLQHETTTTPPPPHLNLISIHLSFLSTETWVINYWWDAMWGKNSFWYLLQNFSSEAQPSAAMHRPEMARLSDNIVSFYFLSQTTIVYIVIKGHKWWWYERG